MGEGRRQAFLLAWFSGHRCLQLGNKCGVRDSAAHQLRLIMRAELGNKIGPLWALVIMLEGPKFRPNYEAGRREFGSGRDRGQATCQETCECSALSVVEMSLCSLGRCEERCISSFHSEGASRGKRSI